MAETAKHAQGPENARLHDARQVQEQLKRIVGSPSFRASKRYPRFLTYIVEKELAGAAEELKERLIGIEVFDRVPDYDHTADPCVRVAGSEIRKRLAQYYIQPGCETELRIELRPGSYIPFYYWPESIQQNGSASTDGPVFDPVPAPLPDQVSRRRYHSVLAAIGVMVGCLAVAAFMLHRYGSHTNAFEQFWEPVLRPGTSTLVCVGNKETAEGPDLKFDADKPVSKLRSEGAHVGPNDALALGRVTAVLGKHDRPFAVQVASYTTLSELHAQPVVLIGAMTNPWTSRLLAEQRFRITQDKDPGILMILDADHPDRRVWSFNNNIPVNQLSHDYAIVSRATSSLTGQPMLVVAGLGPYGTNAASEFVSNPQYFQEFLEKAPKEWSNRNLEIILGTEVIDGRSGAPHILAVDVR